MSAAPKAAARAAAEPATHATAPRQAEPGAVFVYQPLNGPAVRLVADEHGIVRPQSPAEVRLADSAGLAVVGLPVADETLSAPIKAPEKPTAAPAKSKED